MAVLLSRKAVVQAAVESTYNTPATLGAGDGVLVSNPKYSVTVNTLERNFVKADLSPNAIINGRKLGKIEFETELRGNGRQNSGISGDAPIIARLFRACGYAMTPKAAKSVKGVFPIGDHNNAVAWSASAASATNTTAICYYVSITTGGASGSAMVTITSDTAGEGSSASALTTGTPKTVGTKGLTITPTFTGSLVTGQRWVVWLLPFGIALDPVSSAQESITLGVHMDGVYHLMPGCFGTFEITAQAGNYATVKWTFTGTYNAAIDDANPNPTYETTLPSQVELARLRCDEFNAIVEKFSFNQANDIQIRPDVSSSDGYIGTRIVARKPTGGIDPEADTVANYDFWGKMAAATRMPFQMRVGTVAGNTVWIFAPSVQYTGMTYTDRNGILSYDAGLAFSRYAGDDEISFFMC